MKNTSTKIIFFGTEEFSLAVLTSLIEADYEIAAVVTKPDSKKGRGQQLAPPKVKVLASKHNIPVWQPNRLKDIEGDIRATAPVAGVLVSFGKIIPQSIIELFTPGIINVHPSLLPRYRGPSPIESAIAGGDSETGVCIMKLSSEMDAGPVYVTASHALKGDETRPVLYQTLAAKGASLLLESLPKILDGTLKPTPQDDTKATYCQLLRKDDGLLDPAHLTAIEAERLVRAYAGFPKTKFSLKGQLLIVTEAHVASSRQTILDLTCRDNQFLCVDELVAPSGRTMSTSAFLHGLRR